MESTFLPSIMIIDDDVAITDYLRNNFHDKGSTGVLVSNELGHAKNLIDMKDIPINAIVADLFFEDNYIDRKNNLIDGIDLLNYSKKQRPDIDLYVFSVWSDRDYEREKAEKLKLDIKEWMPKIYYDPEKKEGTPWGVVSRDLIKKQARIDERLYQKVISKCDLDNNLFEFTECVESLNLPVRTFIQDLDDKKYLIKRPIHTICIKDSKGTVSASTLKIGLSAEGYGLTISEAINDLKDVIKDQVDILSEEPTDNLENFASVVKKRLDQHIKLKK